MSYSYVLSFKSNWPELYAFIFGHISHFADELAELSQTYVNYLAYT